MNKNIAACLMKEREEKKNPSCCINLNVFYTGGGDWLSVERVRRWSHLVTLSLRVGRSPELQRASVDVKSTQLCGQRRRHQLIVLKQQQQQQ